MAKLLTPQDVAKLRRPTKAKTKWPRIEIGADSSRVGKTTATTVIAAGLKQAGYPVKSALEDWQHNPYLQQSYTDSSMAILQSQLWFARRKCEQLQACYDDYLCIQDVHPEMDFIYAYTNYRYGWMKEEHFVTYCHAFRAMPWHKIAQPGLLVYLKVSDAVFEDRLRCSAREFETIETEYFLAMKRYNREWLQAAREDYPVLVVDTDDLAFNQDEMAQQKLVERVTAALGLKPV